MGNISAQMKFEIWEEYAHKLYKPTRNILLASFNFVHCVLSICEAAHQVST